MIYVFEAILIYALGTLMLRISGRRRISEMTIPETVLMISIGTILIQQVKGHDLGVTLAVAAILVLILMGMEYLQIRLKLMEKEDSRNDRSEVIREQQAKRQTKQQTEQQTEQQTGQEAAIPHPSPQLELLAEAASGEASCPTPDRMN